MPFNDRNELSLAKDRIRALLLENVSDTAVALLNEDGYTSITREKKALEGDALVQAVRGIHMLGIRSRTEVTAEVLDHADRLMSIGCFCIGTNQVDLDAARLRGIPVFNAPFSNTRSVAELTLGEIVMLLRGIFPKSASAHAGGWDKSADGYREVRGRTLGIVGYGNIGSQLSVLAEGFGMRVLYYDHSTKLPLGNASRCASLAELLAWSDVVTLHVPETAATQGMIGAAQLGQMKPGAFLINNARGTLVDMEALAASLRAGHLAGAALDVFPRSPSATATCSPPRSRASQRDPDPAYRRQHRGGAVAHRRGGGAQAGRLLRHRLHGRRGQLSPGGAARPAHRHALHARPSQRARRAGQRQPGLRPARRQHRRPVPPDRWRDGLRGGGCRRHPRKRSILAELRALPHTIRARLLYERE
jgi:D-3-phosphoglycerate dehydrogenase